MEKFKLDGKEYKVYSFDGKELILVPLQYRDNKTLAVEAYTVSPDEGEEPYATLTVNLRDPRQVMPGCAFLDDNNAHFLKEWLLKENLCEVVPDGYTRQSGYVTFPLMFWNTSKFYADEKEPEVYLVDLNIFHTEDGRWTGDLGWSFDDIDSTETNSLDEAKETAVRLLEEFPFEEELNEIICLTVVDNDRNEVGYKVLNCPKAVAERYGLTADRYADSE